MTETTKFDLRYLVVGFFLVFSFIAIFSMSITKIAPSADLTYYSSVVYNLFYYVPATLWIGILGLCGLFVYLFTSPRHFSPAFSNAIMFLIAMLILLVFFGLPYAVEPNPRFVDSWGHGETAKGILDSGFLNPQIDRLYLTYPLSFTAISLFSIITNIGLTVLLRFLPLAFVLVFFASLTAFFEKFLEFRLSIVAVFIFAFSTFYLAFHFSPEIFGWIFFLLLLAFIAKGISQVRNSKEFLTKSDSVIVLTLIVAIALSHPVTQFTVLILMLVWLIVGSVLFKYHYVSLNLVLFAAIVFAAWSLYFGYVYFQVVVEGFQTAFQRIFSSFSSSMAARALTESSPAEIAVLVWYRRLLYVFTPLTGLFGGILCYRRNKHGFIFLICFLVTSLILVPLTVFGTLPIERSLKLAFLPLSIFSALFIGHKKKLGIVLLVLILATIPVNFAAFYSGEAQTMTHDWEVNSAKFVSESFHGVLLGEFKTTTIMNYYGNYSRIVDDYSLYGTRPNIFNITFIEIEHAETVYVTQLTIERATGLGIDIDMNSFINSTEFSCVHSNGYSSLYFRKDPSLPPL